MRSRDKPPAGLGRSTSRPSPSLRVLTIVRSSGGRCHGERRARRAEIRQAAVELFDFDEMSPPPARAALDGRLPRRAAGFHSALHQPPRAGLIRTHSGTIVLRRSPSRARPSAARTRWWQSRMAAGKGEVAIEYRLFERDGRWAVYDVLGGRREPHLELSQPVQLDPQAKVLCPASWIACGTREASIAWPRRRTTWPADLW